MDALPWRRLRYVLHATFFLVLGAPAVLTAQTDTVQTVTSRVGGWEVYRDRILMPGEIDGEVPDEVVSLPHSVTVGGDPFRATFRASVPINATETPYAIKLRYFGAAYRVFINGVQLRATGAVEPPLKPQYLPSEIVFLPRPGENEIVVHVANDHHRRVRLGEITYGPARAVQRIVNRTIIRDAILFGSLLLLAAYHLVAYSLNRRDRPLLLFAAIAGLSALRVGITTERILVRIWPAMPGELMMKLGYAAVFLLLPLFILYIDELELFPMVTRLRRPAWWLNIAGVLLLAITTVRVYDWVFQYAVPLFLVVAVYSLSLVARSRSDENRQGSIVLYLGIGAVLLAALHDYFREIDVIEGPELLSTGILVFLGVQAYFLAWRFRTSYRRVDALAAEVQSLNATLEQRIQVRTRELEHANERLKTLSTTDVLTGLSNRRHFNEVYEREWNHAVRGQQSIAAIMFDVDYFKDFNDRYGHIAGDEALRTIGTRLEHAIQRKTDVVARFGGEEFVILLPDTEEQYAAAIAESVRRSVEETAITHAGSAAFGIVTISAGVAAATPHASDSMYELINRADQRLYAAKAQGRNRVVSRN